MAMKLAFSSIMGGRRACCRARLSVEPLEPRRLLASGVPAGMDLGQANWFYQNIFLPPGNVAATWNGNVAADNAGALGADYLAAIAARINAYRWMAGLAGGVTLDPTEDAEDQQAALMIAANNQLSHDPPSTWIDYTTEGADAAGVSNLALGASGTGAIDLYMIDPGSNNTFAGHRRWLLYPQTQTMGVGDIPDQSNAVYVIQSQSTPVPAVTTVAWPPAGFVPEPLMPDRWSLQAPYGSDFSNATVTVTENGVAQQVEILSDSGADYGGQAIVWDMPNAPVPQPGQEVVYAVQVDNVVIGGQSQSFSYTTTSFDPLTATQLTPVPALVGFLQAGAQLDTAGGSVTIDVARSMNSGQQVLVDYSTVDENALAGTNYTATSGVLTFSPGQFDQQIVVPILAGDAEHEGGTFLVTLSTPTNASIGPINAFEVTIEGSPPPAQPAPPVLEPGAESSLFGDGATDDQSPAFSGTTDAGATVRLMSGSRVLGTATADASGNYVVAVQSPLPLGMYALTVVAGDSDGSSPASTPLALDIVAPPSLPGVPTLIAAESNGSPGGETTTSSSPELAGTAQAGATIQLLNESGTLLNITQVNSSGSYQIAVPGPLGIGTYNFKVDLIDQYGDVSSPSTSLTITVVNPPAPALLQTIPARKKGSIPSITMYFSQALTLSSVENSGNFIVVDAGKTHIFGGRGNSMVKVKSVAYDSAANSVMLTFVKTVRRTDSLRLTINAQPQSGLRGADGQFLNATATATPGLNDVVYLGARAKTPPPPKPKKAPRSRKPKSAIDSHRG
jgi:hypothetical protein